MKYKISEVSKISRISTSGLRFYEEIGIISPDRRKNRRYRDYSQRELDVIFEYKTYRALGFSQQEAVSLLIDTSPENLSEKYEVCRQNVLREIEEKKLLARFIGEQAEQIERSRSEPHACTIVNCPAILRIDMWQPGKREGEFVPFGFLQEWFDRIPFVDACFVYDPDEIASNEDVNNPSKGVGIEAEYAAALGFLPDEQVERIPAQRCVHTFVELTDELTLRGSDLGNVRQFLADQHLTISGKVVSRHLYNAFYKTENLRVDQLWIPIQ
jgi:DNA-binding transcriptional MerR regulator